jgi:hypothetical protein
MSGTQDNPWELAMKTLKMLYTKMRKWMEGGPRQRPARQVRLEVEALEERRVLSVTYHGGAVLSNVQVQALYLGSDWVNNSTYNTQSHNLDSFLGNVVNSSYMDMLGNAYGSRNVLPGGKVGSSSLPGTTSVTPAIGRGNAYAGGYWNVPINKTQYLSDSTIQTDLVAAIDTGMLQGPGSLGSNNLYVVYVEDNVAVDGTAVPGVGGTSVSKFLGYHAAFGSTLFSPGYTYSADIHYAVIPYPGGSIPLSSGTVANTGPWSWLNAQDSMTLSTSHELAEAVTDPNVNYKTVGWYDDTLNGEIGDISNAWTVYLNGYAVQREADPNDQAMTPAGARPATPVNFVLDNSGNLYMGSGSSLNLVDSGIASISDQSIDNFGNAMIDVVFTNGQAYEYHAGSVNSVSPNSYWKTPQPIASGIQSAKAGQGVSYLLTNSGTVQEYKDGPATLTTIDTTGQVTAIDAGTDRYGVNMVAEVRTDLVWQGFFALPQSDGYELSDSTGLHAVRSGTPGAVGVLTLSAGQQGNIGILWNGTATWYNEVTGNNVQEGTGVTQFTMGTDENGGVQFDMLDGNGILYQSSQADGLRIVGYFQSIGKAHAGWVDAISSGTAYAEFLGGNQEQRLASNAVAVA